MVCHVARMIGLSAIFLIALSVTAPAFAMGKGGGGGKPPKDDLMGEAAIVVSAGGTIPEVQVFDVNGNGPQVVVKGNKDEFFWEPVWAPEGIHIALRVSDRVGCRDSVRITTFDEFSAEWSIPEMIICARRAADLDWDPSWDPSSPDLHRIYLRADPDPNDGFFRRALAFVEFALNADGNLVGPGPILVFPKGTDDDKVWTLAVSPNGDTIAVTRTYLYPDDSTDIALFDGVEYTPLLDVVGPDDETFWPNRIAWHPLGNYLTVSLSTDLLGSKIYCVEDLFSETPTATVATNTIAAGFNRQDDDPAWSPDGRQFFFMRDGAIARITFNMVPLNCDDFVDGVASSEDPGRFEFLLQPSGKIKGYGVPSVRLP